MSSAPQEIAEEMESLLPVEHMNSSKEASSSQLQQNGAPRQEPKLSTSTEDSRKQPKEETANDGGDSASGERREWFLEPPSEWTLEDTRQLISEHGTRIVDAVDAEGNPIFWDAVKRDQLDCASALLDYAKGNGIHVKFIRESGDLLSRAIDNGSDVHVRFVLDMLAGKYATLVETVKLLQHHYISLMSDVHEITYDYIKKDRFAIEYARFKVPKTLFGRNARTPIAMSTDHHLESWTMDNRAAKDLWIQKSKYGQRLSDTEGEQIKAVAKFNCIANDDFWALLETEYVPDAVQLNRVLLRRGSGFNIVKYHLLGATEGAKISTSETARALVDWFYGFYRNFYLMGVLLDVVVAVAFTVFAILYSHKDDADADAEPVSRGTVITLIAVSCFANLLGILCSFSLLRVVMLIIDVVLFAHTYNTYHCTDFAAFTTSVGCILCWVVFFRTLRPFGRFGPFVSMVGYAMNDSLPFAMMGLLLTIGYSAAFMVLFNMGDGDGENFNTFPHALETLFHTGLGNFEPEMLRPSSDFLTVWRALLFNSFVYIGPIALMSLLISILTDTHDRVRSKEIGEQTMYRLQAVFDCAMVGWFVKWCVESEICGEFCTPWIYKTVLWVIRRKNTELDKIEGTYFHFLVPEGVEEGSLNEEWHGKLAAIKKTIRFEAGKNNKALGEIRQNTKNELIAVFDRLRKMEETMGEMRKMDETMSDMKTAIDQILQKLASPEPSLT